MIKSGYDLVFDRNIDLAFEQTLEDVYFLARIIMAINPALDAIMDVVCCVFIKKLNEKYLTCDDHR